MNCEEQDTPVHHIRQGDGEALAAFIESHRARLLGFLRSISSDRLRVTVEAGNLLQEVSAAALTDLATAPLDRYEPLE
jgi:RNA polymerase sigma-70 factor (ECF subfamily)